MGGMLLKNWGLPEKRLNSSEYEQFKNSLLKKLSDDIVYCTQGYHPELLCDALGVAPAIRQKESHGDIDIVIGVDRGVSGKRDYKDVMWRNSKVPTTEQFTTAEYLVRLSGYVPHVNSNTISFPYNGFQVDLTFIPLEDYYSSINYNSWGDCSNLMGRVFHKMGLHYGHIGLSFWIRQGMFDNDITWSDNDHIYEKVILTKDMKTICEIGGFDYDRWRDGFDTNEEVYQFIADSKYFDPDIFSFENLNHINRTRSRKRVMYAGFIQWLEDTNPAISENAGFLDKTTYSLIFQDRFPVLRDAIAKYQFEYKITKALKSRFDGRILLEKYGITDGPTIGKIVKSIKSEFTPIQLISMSETILDNLIKKTISEFTDIPPQ